MPPNGVRVRLGQRRGGGKLATQAQREPRANIGSPDAVSDVESTDVGARPTDENRDACTTLKGPNGQAFRHTSDVLNIGEFNSAGRRTLRVVVVTLDPGHELAQVASSGLDRMLLTLGPQGLELRRSRILVGDETRREGSRP